MKECMNTTMLGETAYTLKNISINEDINMQELVLDISKGLLKPSGKFRCAFYVVQSELDRYLQYKKEHTIPDWICIDTHTSIKCEGTTCIKCGYVHKGYSWDRCPKCGYCINDTH